MEPTEKTTCGRRQFILQSIAGAGAFALAYVLDAAKVDKAKQPKFAAGQNCAN